MITPLEKIIVCLDHTELDKELIENACQLSKVASATDITFLNIIQDFDLPEAMKKEFPDLIDKAINERKKEINDLVEKHFECDIPTSILVKQGSKTKEILRVATSKDADLIILGRRVVSDSVLSTRIARRSPCNLLLIPEGMKLKFDKIFIPVDFSDYSTLSLEKTLDLTSVSNSRIYLQNVFNVPSSYRYSGKSYEEFAEIMKGHTKKDLDLLIKKVKVGSQELIPVFTLDKGENINILIMKEAMEKKVDLLVMGAKGRTAASALFIGSKAEHMIRINNEIPMMIIRKKGGIAGIIETLKESLD